MENAEQRLISGLTELSSTPRNGNPWLVGGFKGSWVTQVRDPPSSEAKAAIKDVDKEKL